MHKFFNKKKIIVFSLFIINLMIGINNKAFAEIDVFNKPKGIKSTEFFHMADVLYSPSLQNSNLSIEINNVGTFTMQNAEGKWLLYPESYTTGFSMKIDGNIYCSMSNLSSFVTTGLKYEDNETAYIEYTTAENVKIKQTFYLPDSSEAVEFRVTATNNDSVPHDVQVRYLFDTQIDKNDGSPLYAQGIQDVTGSSICTHETNIENVNFSQWKGYDIWPSPNLETVGTILNVPERMVFAWWPDASSTEWDYPLKDNANIDVRDEGWDPEQPFFRNSGGDSPQDDSCVLQYYNLGTVDPGETRECKTYYGVGAPTFSSGKEKFRNSVIELNNSFYEWVRYVARLNSHIFTRGLEKVRSSEGHEKARAVIGLVSAGISLATSGGQTKILSSSVGDLMGVYGVTEKTARAIKYLASINGFKMYFNCIHNMDSILGAFFNDEVFANSMITWLKDNEENLTRNWDLYQGENNVKNNFYSFLWNEVRWSENPDKPSGLKGLTDTLASNNVNWSNTLCLQSYSDYPYERVANKVLSVAKTFQEAQHSPRMLVWLNDQGNDMELGNLRQWVYQLEAAIEDYENANWWSWAGTALSLGLNIGKAALIPLTGGISAVALVAEVCVTAASITVAIGQTYWDYMQQAPANDNLADQTNRSVMAGQQEAVNALNGVGYLREYLDYENIDQLIFDSNVDNKQIRLNEFTLENIELDDNTKAELNEDEVKLKVQNDGSDQIPVRSYIMFYAKIPDGSIEGPINLLFQEDDLQYISNPEIQIDFKKAELFSQETLGAEYYIALGYVAAGPALISKVYGPVIDNFTITEEPGLIDSIINFITREEQPELEEGEVHSYNYSSSSTSVFSDFSLLYPGSDLDLHAYDVNGNHVGVNYVSGEIEIQIPGASYGGSSENPEWIRVPHSNGYDYRVEVVGLETEGSERYEVIANDVPDRPAIMDITPNHKEVNIDKTIMNEARCLLKISEMGGQRDIKDIIASVNDLVTNNGPPIASENIKISLSDHAIPASGSINVLIEIQNIGRIASGKYEGVLNVQGQQGSATQARMASVTPFSIRTLDALDAGRINEEAAIIFNINQSQEDAVIELDLGWNLISLCKQPADTSIDSVLKGIEDKYSSVWSFQNNSWKVYDPHQPGFSDLSTMDAGWGYWINMMEAAELPVTGTEPSKSIDLIRGWCLSFN